MSSRFPFPSFPNGWFQAAYGEELPPGGVVPLKYFGKEFVLFRTESGKVNILDAYCPHLGSHLGYGGTVEGESIRCPFHAYRFDGSGECVDVPYARKIPALARLLAWPVQEVNGLIMLYHHALGEPPAWAPPEVPEYGSEEWTPYETRRWKIRTHNQEMAENSVDSAHFKYVHGTLTQPITTAEADGPVLRATSHMKLGTPMGVVDGIIESTAYGFGFAVVRFKGIVDTLLVTSVTPIDGEYVDARFAFSVKKLGNASATRGVGAALIADVEKQMSQDIPIWENKVYLPRPALCDGDGPIGLFRRWARQFYSNLPAEVAAQ